MGKSWLAMQLAVAIASGRPALGQYPVDRGEVLYLALEDRQRRLQARMRAVLQGQQVPAGLYFDTEWPRLNDGGTEKLIAWLDDHPAAKAVVIDVWVKVRPPTGNNRANIYEIDYSALEPLRRIVAERGILLLLVHHFRKGDADDPLDLISGSTGIAGFCDTLLILKRERGKAEAFLYVTGRDITDTDKALQFDSATGLWSVIGDAEEYRHSEERRRIIAAIREAGRPLGPKDIAEASGLSYGSVKHLVRKMEADRILLSIAGRYDWYRLQR
jgi:AAA domain/Winged helix-turn-helix DNA-binding